MSQLLDVIEETAELVDSRKLRVSVDPDLVLHAMFVGEADEPVMANLPAQIAHPLAPPTVSGTSITVDTMLKQPTRITRLLMDMTLQRFVADRIFASAGGVTGGSVIYDSLEANDLYMSRDVERVAPGAEFPILTSPMMHTLEPSSTLFPSTGEPEKEPSSFRMLPMVVECLT